MNTDTKPLRALTLHQPYATAMALGLKKVETRGWSTTYRGPVVIHSAQKQTGEMAREFYDHLHRHPADAAVFSTAGYRYFSSLPFGQSLAVADLVDVVPVEKFTASLAYYTPSGELLHRSATEERWGDYTPGRFAWIFQTLRRLERPRHVSGAQGLWTWRHGDLEVPAVVHGSTPSASTSAPSASLCVSAPLR